MSLAKEKGIRILPVDSEHSAIFQCLNGENRVQLKKILLTASGGPFRGKKKEELKNVQVEDALKHPNWHMGRKITIDSATLVNKGLEMMEARWLFGVEPDNIQIVVQPKSIIHSMVEFVDGAVIAQLGTPDMKLPIQYALYYPERRYLPGDRLDFWTLGQITFEKPDMENFPGLRLAFDAAAAGGSLPTVYNAANERAVALFLEKKIGFLEIPEIIQSCMEAHRVIPDPTVEQILEMLDQAGDSAPSVFSYIADQVSQDPGRSYYPNGYLVTEDADFLPEFKEAALALEENEYSGIVETEAGYHIILRRPIRQYVADDYLSGLMTVAMDNAEVTYSEAYETLDVRQFQIDYQTYSALHSAVQELTDAAEENSGDTSDSTGDTQA